MGILPERRSAEMAKPRMTTEGIGEVGNRLLGIQPLPLPAIPSAPIGQAIMQPMWTPCPELDYLGRDTIARPMGGTRHLSVAKALLHLRNAGLEFLPA